MTRSRKNTVLAAKSKEANRNAASQNSLTLKLMNHMYNGTLDFDRHKMNAQAITARHKMERAALAQQHKIELSLANAKMKRSQQVHKAKADAMKKVLAGLKRKLASI